MKKCLLHPENRTSTLVNGVKVCRECWNSASAQERKWFEKATKDYSLGLSIKEELNDTLFLIGCHRDDPSIRIEHRLFPD